MRILNHGRYRNLEHVALRAFHSLKSAFSALKETVDAIILTTPPGVTRRLLQEQLLTADTATATTSTSPTSSPTTTTATTTLLESLRTQHCIFCPLYRSLANAAEILQLFPSEQILIGSTLANAALSLGATIEGAPNRPTMLWPFSNEVELTHRGLVQELTKSGLPTTLTGEAAATLWKKLALDCAMNSVTALLGIKVGQAANRGLGVGKQLMRRMCREVIRVAGLEGVHISSKDMDTVLDFVLGKSGDFVSPMCDDVIHGRPTETEYQGGLVLKFAKAHRVKCPVVKAMHYSMLLFQGTYKMRLLPASVELERLKSQNLEESRMLLGESRESLFELGRRDYAKREGEQEEEEEEEEEGEAQQEGGTEEREEQQREMEEREGEEGEGEGENHVYVTVAPLEDDPVL